LIGKIKFSGGVVMENPDLENSRTAYEVASSYASMFAESFWSVFNAMIVANSIVVIGLGIVYGKNSILKIFLNIIGIVLCILWFLLMQRHREMERYYILSAREIEQDFGRIQTLSRGATFSHGESVEIKIPNLPPQRLSFLARLMRGKVYSYVIVLMFILFYVMFFFAK
jgi:hypothetical protein